MHTKKEVDLRLIKAGIQPLKKLGQNFLVNPVISARLVEAAKEFNPQQIIEIGPGLGALTDDLIQGPWELTLIEIDADNRFAVATQKGTQCQ